MNWKRIVFYALVMVLTVELTRLVFAKQEHDATYPQTRIWEIAFVNGERINVIDTAGVCLYVITNRADHRTSMAAVPKTQLPKGAGCQ